VLRARLPAVLKVLDIVNAAAHLRLTSAGFRAGDRGHSLASNTAI